MKRGENLRTHGMSRTPENNIWRDMHARCKNPNRKEYKRYGGRGIAVCERWEEFENFLRDMGSRPTPLHTLERSDGDGNYCPENCRWATRKEQSRNTSRNRFFELDGRRVTLAELVEERGLSYGTVSKRLSRGFSIERALR